jgi:hypothetical protein
MTSTEQDGIYRRKNSNLLGGIHIDPNYTINKILGSFVLFFYCYFLGESVHFWIWKLCLGSLSMFAKNLTKIM